MKDDNDITKEGTEAILQLFRVFQQISDASAKNCIQELPGQIVKLSNQVSQAETKQQQTLYNLESLKQQLDNMTSANSLLENAVITINQLGKQHFDEHVIEPIARSLFPVFDLIADANKHWSSSDKVIELLNVIWTQMAQFLAVYDIHAITHNAEDEFTPKTMKPLTWVPVDNKNFDGLVAESLQTGFQFGNERMLRLETVSLFKYQPSETNSITLNERTER
jgi:molecular chaperone GrpE (heat shock protein)